MKKTIDPIHENVEESIAVAEPVAQTAETEVDVAMSLSEESDKETSTEETEAPLVIENMPKAEQFDKQMVDVMIAEAESRGYLRGRNERISELMRQPAVYERQSVPADSETSFLASDGDWTGESRPMILNNPHVSIWDR